MRLTALLVAALILLPTPALAEGEAAEKIADNRAQIEKPSRQTIGPVIAALAASGDPMADDILSVWAEKRLVIRKSDNALLLAAPEGDGLTALDGVPAGTATKDDLTVLKPNAGLRGNAAGHLRHFHRAPGWLDGALSFNDVESISYIRIAIFALALMFLMIFLYLLKRTRLGLEVRAVTQNSTMAASMGINPDRNNMLTFGLGSGIAGITGVAIGLFAKVT